MKKSLEGISEKFKEFGPTSWAINNRTAIYIIAMLISFYGYYKFITLPKEQYPDIVVPTISVTTIYAGNSPEDIENLVTRPIEKELKSISGAKINKISSVSQNDFSLIVVEFDTRVSTDLAKIKVKDAIDKAETELPNDLTQSPHVQEFAMSEIPIMYVNISGAYDGIKLKEFAEKLQDRYEDLPEINRADIVGAPEREIQVNVDPVKMQNARVSFTDIENAIFRENMDITGGLIEVGQMKRTLKIAGQFKSANALNDVIVRSSSRGAVVYLKDIAEIKDTIKDKDSYARLDGNNVVTLNIVKRAGENLINAAQGIKDITAEMQQNGELPQDLKVVITGDQSKATATSFHELVNTIIIGFILVLVILMFFMGVTNAFFVALSVPLSVFVAFLFFPIGDMIVGTPITLNFIVLFGLLFALGIIVDDAIVVIENTHRIYNNGKVKIERSAKEAAGEVFIPVLAGTITTVAPFVPLLMWEGLIGKFMIYLPVILILTLMASLVVAFIFNPVFAVSFMKPEGREHETPPSDIFKKWWWWTAIAFGVLFHLFGWTGVANFMLFMALLSVLNVFVFRRIINTFQGRVLPGLMNRYEKLLNWILKGRRPALALLCLFLLFPIVVGLLYLRGNETTFFPSGDPNMIYVYLKMPPGTDVKATDSVMQILDKRVYEVLKDEMPDNGGIVESVITNVANSANNPRDLNRSVRPNLGRIQISFVEFEKRNGKSTKPYLEELRKVMVGIPGASIEVAQEEAGPPTDPPVNIEISGDEFRDVAYVATQLSNYIDTSGVTGIENLRMDVDLQSPDIIVRVDRERALMEGLSTAQIGMELRTAIFGKEVSNLKVGDDEYEIQLRYKEEIRNNVDDLLNTRISFMDMNTMQIKSIPLSAVATIDYTNSSSAIARKNVKRTIQLQSNVLDPTMTAKVNQQLTTKIKEFKSKHILPDGVQIKQTGQGEQEAETGSFLFKSLLISLGLIFMVLVLQFNSLSKPFIILNEIFFSILGVLIGYAITGMTISTIMLGVGIIGLAGIVIKNGILLIEFTDELRMRGMKTREATIQAGKIRIVPVMLTAIATMMGLFPLAIGFNIDFARFFTELNPHIFFGGDSVVFWGPLSWTIIFGLIFAFFMTLIMVPSMYIISERLRRPMQQFYGTKYVALLGFTGPLFFLLVGIMYLVRKIQGKKVWNGVLKESK